MKLKPMSDAPKDGTQFLALYDDMGWTVLKWDDDDFRDTFKGFYWGEPKGWIDIPEVEVTDDETI